MYFSSLSPLGYALNIYVLGLLGVHRTRLGGTLDPDLDGPETDVNMDIAILGKQFTAPFGFK